MASGGEGAGGGVGEGGDCAMGRLCQKEESLRGSYKETGMAHLGSGGPKEGHKAVRDQCMFWEGNGVRRVGIAEENSHGGTEELQQPKRRTRTLALAVAGLREQEEST